MLWIYGNVRSEYFTCSNFVNLSDLNRKKNSVKVLEERLVSAFTKKIGKSDESDIKFTPF